MSENSIQPNDNNYTDPYSPDYVDPYAEATPEQAGTTTNRNSLLRMLNPFNLVIIGIALGLVALVAYGIYDNQIGTVGVGEQAPDFTITLYGGEEFQLADFEGEQVVVINFWHTQCPPCHDEARTLERVWQSYRDQNVIFIGVNVKDPDRVAFEFMEQYGITYPNGLDRADKISKDLYRTTGWPETFIVDRDGVITMHHNGAISERQLRAEIDKALGGA
jgi:cytochrome c biogenesis protein CcmG, thiol:disulfide interchange protein DsbE